MCVCVRARALGGLDPDCALLFTTALYYSFSLTLFTTALFTNR